MQRVHTAVLSHVSDDTLESHSLEEVSNVVWKILSDLGHSHFSFDDVSEISDGKFKIVIAYNSRSYELHIKTWASLDLLISDISEAIDFLES